MKKGSSPKARRVRHKGATISPLLANVYLHYVFDLWAQQWRKRHATGDMIIVRCADDVVLGFEHEAQARGFLDELRTRSQEFSLSLHPDKTRLIAFGRHVATRRERHGLGKPETFTFLGFTLICGRTRTGHFQVLRKTRTDRMRVALRRGQTPEVGAECVNSACSDLCGGAQ